MNNEEYIPRASTSHPSSFRLHPFPHGGQCRGSPGREPRAVILVTRLAP